MQASELIVITGPTASGKSMIALELCARIGGELVSCDSMQLYRGMDIGTAKPTDEERSMVRHHMIDVLDPGEPCSAAAYREMAKTVLDALFMDGAQPVLCGGTGLYINALTKPLGFSGEGDPALRAELARQSPEELYRQLERIDPQSAKRLHANDVRRVIRAIEVFHVSGRTLTEQMRADQERTADYSARLFALEWPRDVLYARIDRRVDDMVERGLIGEVRSLLDAGLAPGSTAMQAIGYKEIASALSGEIGDMRQAIEQIKQRTRNYAKRQLTWFRRDERVRWIPAQRRTIGQIIDEVMEEIKK